MMIAFLIWGWFLAALFALLLWGARKANHGWQRLYEEKRDALHKLEMKHIQATDVAGSMGWLREENSRLILKCEAICSQIRKMKGRGKSGVNPIHHF